jgi:uncharacterized protein YjiS (DUF1127 family)
MRHLKIDFLPQCSICMAPLPFWHWYDVYVSLTFRINRGAKTPPGREYEVSRMDVVGRYKGWRKYRRTVNELSSLSNRELEDLGINRVDIPFIARQAR